MEPTKDVDPGVARIPFASYTITEPIHALEDLRVKLLERLKSVSRGVIGVETQNIPAALLETVRAQFPHLEFVDISPLLAEMRAVKDADEIEWIRHALGLCDLGQELVRDRAQPGMTEIELLAEVRKGMEAKAGTRLALLADLISGPRTPDIGGHPTSRELCAGDFVISDLVPRFRGYWGDTCNTSVVGEPQTEQVESFRNVATVLEEAVEHVRPGIRACELDAFVRERVRKSFGVSYPHHTVHGIGVTWHEEPRIVPYNQMELRQGMVIALKPGVYFEGQWGVRLERTMLVTKTGVEILSQFHHVMYAVWKRLGCSPGRIAQARANGGCNGTAERESCSRHRRGQRHRKSHGLAIRK